MERGGLKNVKTVNAAERVNEDGTDFRAEVLAAGLIEQQFPVDDILVLRKETGRYGVQKEITAIDIDEERRKGASLVFKVNRRGIYDLLPEGIFHKTGFAVHGRSKENILLDMKRQKQEEFYARSFFSLFESEVDRSRIMMSLKELQFDKKNSHANYIGTFAKYWPIVGEMDTAKAVVFMKIVPLMSRMRISNGEVEKAMSYILELPVKIKKATVSRSLQGLEMPKLGLARLGENLTLFSGSLPAVTVTRVEVGPFDSLKLWEFVTGRHSYKLLELLLDNFLPANSEYEVHYVVDDRDKGFRLNHQDAAVSCFLGINTILTSSTN